MAYEMPGPYEILELQPGESRTFTIEGFAEGEMTIHPPSAPQGKVIPVLRVNVSPDSKTAPPNYYDITSLTLAAQLTPLLRSGAGIGATFTVTKVGSGPSARFTLERSPASGIATG